MPRVGREIKAPFITTGNPDTVLDVPVSSTTVGSAYDLSGQLGAIYRTPDGMREYIYVQFSATSTGKASAQNQVLFWVFSTSTQNWVVDNQTSANTQTSVNHVAGIFRSTSTTLGANTAVSRYVWALRRAPSCNVVSTSTIGVKGDIVVVGTSSGEAQIVSSTSTALPGAGVGTTPWYWLGGGAKLGYVNSTTTSSVNIDTTLDIQ